MGGAHGPRHTADEAAGHLRAGPGLRAVLVALVAALALGTGIGAALLWPSGTPARAVTELPPQDLAPGVVQTVEERTCPGLSEDRRPDGTIPETIRCTVLAVRVEEGPFAGRVVSVNAGEADQQAGMRVGARVSLARIPDEVPATGDLLGAPGAEPTPVPEGGTWALVDFDREFPLTALAVAFAVLVVAVARLRGLAALAGLGLGYLTVLEFMLPAIRSGENAAWVAFVGCVGIMVVVLYLSHGVSAKTTTALFGTTAGLAVTAVLADWAVDEAHLTGLTGDDTLTLSRLVGQGTLSGVVLCGMILAGLGVLNDVTVTQASAVFELRQHAPHLGPWRLFAAGMRIGRDHLASTVYTIAFVYAGAALPTLLLIDLYGQPLGQVLTSMQIAEEIVRTLVGGIGLILAIPLTTGIAVLIAWRSELLTAHAAPAGLLGATAGPAGAQPPHPTR